MVCRRARVRNVLLQGGVCARARALAGLPDAINAIVACRRSLRWSYVFGYFLSTSAQATSRQALFEDIQQLLEKFTEHLQELVEKLSTLNVRVPRHELPPPPFSRSWVCACQPPPPVVAAQLDDSTAVKKFHADVTNYTVVTLKYHKNVSFAIEGGQLGCSTPPPASKAGSDGEDPEPPRIAHNAARPPAHPRPVAAPLVSWAGVPVASPRAAVRTAMAASGAGSRVGMLVLSAAARADSGVGMLVPSAAARADSDVVSGAAVAETAPRCGTKRAASARTARAHKAAARDPSMT